MPLYLVLGLSGALVFIGMFGFLRHRADPLRSLMSLQPVFIGALINLVFGSEFFQDKEGFVLGLFVIGLLGVQTASALALFFLYFNKHRKG